MLVIQHNCRQAYPITIAAFETGLALNAAFICLQEPYVGVYTFSHPGYEIKWPEKGEKKEKRVLIAIRKDLLTKVITETRSDLVNHPYVLALDIWDLQSNTQKKARRTRLINCYDNRIGPNTTYHGDIDSNRRAIDDINWDNLIQGRAILLGDFNAHSPYWNPLMDRRKDADSLEAIIDKFDLILNNEPGAITRPNSRENNSIIDLTFTTTSIGLLNSWLIEEEYTTPSDHELIVFDWQDMELYQAKTSHSQDITGWDIDKLLKNEKRLELATIHWQETAINRSLIDDLSNKEDLENEASWIEETLIDTLNLYAKPLRITAYSKRWWNSTVEKARLKYAQAKRRLKNSLDRGSSQLKRELKLARNNYYYIVRKEKRECWQKFLQGAEEILEDNPTYTDKNRCWTALKYTSSRASSTTPAMKDANGDFATTIEEKEEIFRKMAFPDPIASSINIPFSRNSSINAISSFITEEDIEKALFEQSIKKAPGPDKLNFKALRLLWSWDKARIQALILQCFNQGIHPKSWKKAKGILLRKPNKSDYSIAKSYRVISLLNCLGKVAEKVAATAIANFCEANELLHEGQFGYRKQRNAIDAVAKLIYTTEKAWNQKKLLGALFMDVKGAFDYVVKERLLQRMNKLEIPQFLINWTESFLTNRQAQLVIDGFTCSLKDTNSGVPQGSPVSPILFNIYLSGIFDKIEEQNPEITALSFADDIAFLAPGKTVKDIQDALTNAGEQAIAWGLLNNVKFDIEKTEAVLFTKKRKIRQNLLNYNIKIQSHNIKFNKEATRWLGIWLDAGLSLKEHRQIRLQKAQKAENRLKAISGTFGLASGLVRRVQIAAVQSIALYGAELWWKGQKDAINKFQKLINKQSRAITGAFTTSPIDLLLKEAEMTPIEPLLDHKQRKFTLRALKLPSINPANQLLPPTLRYGDGSAQPNEYSTGNLEWSDNRAKPRNLAQRLAKKLTNQLKLDPSEGFEEAKCAKGLLFPGDITISSLEEAEIEAITKYPGLTIWTDGSRLDSGHLGTGLAWKTTSQEPQWRQKSLGIGYAKEVFDAELIGILEALKIAVKERKQRNYSQLTIFSDSQPAI
jgi:Reverse transcriptase (RNA-dependent DNA polymerase)/Endonuclease-reverse transcriptase